MSCDEILSYLNEYRKAYITIDVKDKIILDIGADVGTSAFYFLTLGAKKIICYSLENQKIFDEKIEWHGKWYGEYTYADILKIDCEGCECMLTKEIIEKYNEWYIAIHIWSNCFNDMEKYLQNNGKLVFVTPDNKEFLYVKN